MALYRSVVTAAYIVFLCNMAISYYHAWEFFHELMGFPGFLAHVAVVGVDTVFAISVLVISTAIMKKISIGGPVWLCFLFGFGFTEWSNIRACWSDGIPGIIAGSSVPMALLCIKFLLSWMVANKDAFASSHTHNVSDSHVLTRKNESHDSHTLSHTDSHEVSHTHSHETDSHEFSRTLSHEADSHELSHTESHESHEVSQTDSYTFSHEDSRVRESHDSHAQDESHNTSESHEESGNESHTQDSHDKESREESHEESHTKRDLREVAREVAREYYKKHGELPTIKGLAAEVGCGEWDARVARNDVKKEFGVVEEKRTRKKRAAAR